MNGQSLNYLVLFCILLLQQRLLLYRPFYNASLSQVSLWFVRCLSMCHLFFYTRKYEDPLPVLTTSPDPIFPLVIGLVVTFSPSLNFDDPVMKPVIDELPFFLHFTKDGTPRGAVALALTVAFVFFCKVLVGCDFTFGGALLGGGCDCFVAGEGAFAPLGAK